MRIAWFSPLPPIPSGIADYSAELLPLIARGSAVDVYTPRAGLRKELQVPPGVSVRRPASFSRLEHSYDAVFHHLGNNPHHGYVYREAQRRPGIAVFHDVVLHHLIAFLYTGKHPNWDRYQAILSEELGDAASPLFRLRRGALWSATEHFLIPLTRHVATRARAIVVHSEEAREKLQGVAPATPIMVIPHHAGRPPPEVSGSTREAARSELGLPADAFIAGQFGFITIPKQPGAVLRGFAKLLERDPNALLLLVGQNQTPGRSLERLIRSVGVGDRVRVIGFVDLPTFYRYLRAVDVVINLRYPSAGEASGTFARALAEGRAVIASNLGSFAEIPSGVALKVEVDGDQADEVGRHLIRLAGDSAFKAALEDRGRAYARSVLDQGRCADLYLEVARSLGGARVTSRR